MPNLTIKSIDRRFTKCRNKDSQFLSGDVFQKGQTSESYGFQQAEKSISDGLEFLGIHLLAVDQKGLLDPR